MTDTEIEEIRDLIASWRKISRSPMTHNNEAMGYARCANELEDFLHTNLIFDEEE